MGLSTMAFEKLAKAEKSLSPSCPSYPEAGHERVLGLSLGSVRSYCVLYPEERIPTTTKQSLIPSNPTRP
jgi:hypothetical protein